MWFLQINTLLIISIVSIFVMLFVNMFYNKKHFVSTYKYVLLAASLIGLFLINNLICAFYCAFVIISFLMVCLLNKIKKGKHIFFAISVLLCFAPLIFVRIINMNYKIDFIWLTIGIAFNMLKAADSLFYTYYTGNKIKFITYANFILFLPTITAGPIMRYRDFENGTPQPIKSNDMEYCVKRIIRGMFKKMVVVIFVLQVFNRLLELNSNFFVSITVIALSYLILFFDLSGYSDIAISFGRICGITVAENFKNPFKAPSLTMFWRNWHVTLSDWIREHIFIIFSQKKLSKIQTSLIAFSTMVFMSLWHGFNVLFIITGVYNGALLMFENLFSITGYNRKSSKLLFYSRCLLTNFLFAINTLVFTTDFEHLTKIIKGLIKL